MCAVASHHGCVFGQQSPPTLAPVSSAVSFISVAAVHVMSNGSFTEIMIGMLLQCIVGCCTEIELHNQMHVFVQENQVASY